MPKVVAVLAQRLKVRLVVVLLILVYVVRV
jgi:hypothetical protein